MKLHLGSGSVYLDGYVNIDYPQESHTTNVVKADKLADLRTLDYPTASIDEVRLHHTFEHFSRQWALKLLGDWHRWLKVGGTLTIEVPDFDELANRYVKADLAYQFKLLRHMFGSHEAHWAYHYDGWGEQKFRFILGKFGFENLEFKKILAYHSNIKIPKVGGAINRTPFEALKDATGDRLPNILVHAKKSAKEIDYPAVITEILSMSLAGGREDAMLKAWLTDIGL
jgi:hypothetical protein